MPPRRRPTTAAALVLLFLTVAFGPIASGTGPSASGLASTASEVRAHTSDARSAEEARPRTDGGSCRPRDLPLKGTEAVVAQGHTDPLTGPGPARSPLPQAPPPSNDSSRAPPSPVVGCAELLPVLRL